MLALTATPQFRGWSLSNIGENLALLNNGSNGDSVPATVPGSELVGLTRQRLKLALTRPAAV
jgi:hypothetical protein